MKAIIVVRFYDTILLPTANLSAKEEFNYVIKFCMFHNVTLIIRVITTAVVQGFC